MEARERILQKANELFHKYGIRTVTMDEIATQIGMSKKTIYQSFANKDDLVDAVIQEHIEKNTERCEVEHTKAENAIHQIFLSLDSAQEMLAEINPLTVYELQKFHPITFNKIQHFKHLFLYKIIYENIEWGIKDGLYREGMNIDIITKLRLYTMFMPFNLDVFPANKYNIINVENVMMEHFLYGLATTKAHKLIVKYKFERAKTS